MEENEYKIELRKVLDENLTDAIKKMNSVLNIIPIKSKGIELMIFPSQDGDGSFGVRLSLTGSDLYVLNKSILNYATIFEVQHTKSGLEPSVPMMGFDSIFDVNMVLSNVVSEWLKLIWTKAETKHVNIPVSIISSEGSIILLLKAINK